MRTTLDIKAPVALSFALGFAISISANVSTFGQSTKPSSSTEDLAFLPRWSKGEGRVYEQVRGRRITSKDGKETKAGSRARLDVKVVDANPQGYLVSWMISETTLDEPQAPKQQNELANLLKMMEGWIVLLDVDESGNLKGVRNWKDIKSKIEDVNKTLLSNQMYQSLRPEVQEAFRAQLKARSQTKEQVEELCAREAKAFLAPIGLRFKAGKPIEYETKLPSPRGGESFPAQARFDITRVDPSSGRAIITWRQIVKPIQKSSGLGETVAKLGRGLGRPPGPGETNPYKSLSIADECQYLMDMRSGWVNDMKQTRTIRNPDGSSIQETLRIRRIDTSSRTTNGESVIVKPAPPSRSQ